MALSKGLAVLLAVGGALGLVAAASSGSSSRRNGKTPGDDDQGNDDQGDDDQGNDDQGNDDQGNDDQGNDDQGNDDHGNDDQGNDDHGNDDQGNDDQGNDDQGNDDQGDDDQGDQGGPDDDHSDDEVPPGEDGRDRDAAARRRYRAALQLESLALTGGGDTTRARADVRIAQRDLGVAVDGVIGRETVAAMARELVTAPDPATTTGTREEWERALDARRAAYEARMRIATRRTMAPSLVRAWQSRMGLTGRDVDGVWGDLSRARALRLLGDTPLEGTAEQQRHAREVMR